MDDYTDVNRANWDARTAINAGSTHYDVAGFKSWKLSLHQLERDEVGDVAAARSCTCSATSVSTRCPGPARSRGHRRRFLAEGHRVARSLAEELRPGRPGLCARTSTTCRGPK
jgi:hypothetical protein